MPIGEPLLIVALYIVAINAAGFVAFAWDKHRARKGLWRISEGTLLTIAAIGGTFGAITASRLLRHKTQKQPFKTILYGIAVLQVIGLVALLVTRW